MNNDAWIYFKLGAGSFEGMLDHFVSQILAGAARSVNAKKWFFIRYYDETSGLHIRFRALVDGSARAAAVSTLSTYFAKEYTKLNNVAPSSYQRMVSIGDFQMPVQMLGVREEVYEPELDKFGGPAGIADAEQWFHASSEIAVDIISLENSGKVSRKSIAPLLISTVVKALVENRQAFLEFYSMGWLPGDRTYALSLRDEFFEKAGELADAGIVIVPDQADMSSETTALVGRWRQAVTVARESMVRQRNPDENYLQLQAWQMIHLMNNRLGFSPLEEAYLATLVEAHYSMVSSYAA